MKKNNFEQYSIVDDQVFFTDESGIKKKVYILDEERLGELLADSAKLCALEAAGVHGWEGYDIVM